MTEEIQEHLTAHGFLQIKKIIFNNFLGGLAWGFGSVLGATVVVAVLIGLLRSFHLIPGLSDVTDQLVRSIYRNPPPPLIDNPGN